MHILPWLDARVHRHRENNSDGEAGVGLSDLNLTAVAAEKAAVLADVEKGAAGRAPSR